MSRSASAAVLSHITTAAKQSPEGMGAEWIPVLQSVPLFEGLSKRHLRHVADLARAVRFTSGTTVVRAGSAGDTFYVIIDGEARVQTPAGDDVRLGPLDFFGEMSLIDGGPRSATVVAASEMLTMRLARPAFLKTLRSEPEIALGIMKLLVKRIRAAEDSALA